MQGKLDEYFELVERIRTGGHRDVAATKARLREVSGNIKSLASRFSDPSADMNKLVSQLQALRQEHAALLSALDSRKLEVEQKELKRKAANLRDEILASTHMQNWEKLVEEFRNNPVALTALVWQAGHTATDPVKSLRALPFSL